MAKNKEIKMRVCKESTDACQVCGAQKDKCLDMFEICFPGVPSNTIIRLCDKCNDQLFYKTLKANCYTNGRLKSQHDMSIIQKRSAERNGSI